MYECRAKICCKDYGCGKLMCADHRSKKFIVSLRICCAADNAKQYACFEHEDEASKCSLIVIFIPIFLALLSILIMASVITSSDDDTE